MPDLDGLGLLARMREDANATPVIVQTAHGGIDNVISAMRAGAVDFVVKPVGAERLQVSLKNALTTSALAGELQRIKRSRDGTLTFKDIVTRSALMRSGVAQCRKGRGLQHSGSDRRRIRRRQGTGRARHPRLAANAAPSLSSRSIAARSPTISWSRSCSATRRAPSPARPIAMSANSPRPPAARCSSMRSANCRSAAQVKLLRAVQEGEIEPVGARKTREDRRAADLGDQSQSDR